MQKSVKYTLIALLCLALLCGAAIYCARAGKAPAVPDTDADTGNPAADAAAATAKELEHRAEEAGSGNATVRLADGATTVSGAGVGIRENTVTVSAPGIYTFSGELSDGQIVVDADGEVILILAGVRIGNASDAAICVTNADHTLIRLADGTENFLCSGTEQEITSAAENAALENASGAALYARDDLSISGDGSLTVCGYINNAIATTDCLTVLGGNITCTAVNNGLKGKDSVTLSGGEITILSGNDGIKANNDTDADCGNVYIQGGKITVTSLADGIQAAGDLFVTDGELSITTGSGSPAGADNAVMPADLPADPAPDGTIPPTMPDGMAGGFDRGETGKGGMSGDRPTVPGGDKSGGKGFADWFESGVSTSSDGSAKGLKSDGDLTVTGGSIRIFATDDALHANGSITVTGGELYLETEDDGIHADGTLTVSDCAIVIARSHEGLEAHLIYIESGDISVTAEDDGVNANGGSSSAFGGFFGATGGSSDQPLLKITGGSLYVNAGGDGLDSNGELTIEGGTVIVDGPTNAGNGALDSDGSLTCNGGTVLAIGAAGMAETFSAASAQCSFALTSSTAAAGTQITITDKSGNLLFTHTAAKSFSSIVFSSPELTVGETYTVRVGSTEYTVTQSSVSVGGGSSAGGMGGNRPGFGK